MGLLRIILQRKHFVCLFSLQPSKMSQDNNGADQLQSFVILDQKQFILWEERSCSHPTSFGYSHRRSESNQRLKLAGRSSPCGLNRSPTEWRLRDRADPEGVRVTCCLCQKWFRIASRGGSRTLLRRLGLEIVLCRFWLVKCIIMAMVLLKMSTREELGLTKHQRSALQSGRLAKSVQAIMQVTRIQKIPKLMQNEVLVPYVLSGGKIVS